MTKTRRIHPTEDEEQIAVFEWAKLMEPQYPELAMLFHIPNGGYKLPLWLANKFKKMGLKAGYPDIGLDVARGGFFGLRIELKSQTGTLKPAQAEWLDRLTEQGYMAVVCVGAKAAIDTIEAYLKLDDR